MLDLRVRRYASAILSPSNLQSQKAYSNDWWTSESTFKNVPRSRASHNRMGAPLNRPGGQAGEIPLFKSAFHGPPQGRGFPDAHLKWDPSYWAPVAAVQEGL
jgi:hypothetical protein